MDFKNHPTDEHSFSKNDVMCRRSRLREARSWFIPVLAPLVFLGLIYPFFESIDMYLSRLTFSKEDGLFHPPSWCTIMYTWGLIPGQILFLIAAFGTAFGLIYKRYRRKSYWFASLYLFLTLSIGSGLIAHGIFKENFVRPRPRQVHEFGGNYPYTRATTPYTGPLINKEDRLRSMPSGHATMGYYFFAFYFLGRRWRNRWLLWSGLSLGLILGGALTISRVLEGGHFFTDGLASFVIMWYTALFLDFFWTLIRKRKSPEDSSIDDD